MNPAVIHSREWTLTPAHRQSVMEPNHLPTVGDHGLFAEEGVNCCSGHKLWKQADQILSHHQLWVEVLCTCIYRVIRVLAYLSEVVEQMA